MGTFEGHAMLCPPLLIIGMWYIVQSLRRYYRCQNMGLKYTSSFAFPADFLPGRFKDIPIDSILKVFFPVFFILAELLISYVLFEPPSHMIAWQHITVEVPIILAGAVEMLLHYRVPIMEDWDYAANACLFLIETMTLFFHLHGSSLERRLHLLYVISTATNFILALAEAKYRHHVMLPVMRGATLMLRASWMVEVAFVLYNPFGPAWNENMHMNLTLVTIHYSWHIILIMLTSIAISVPIAMKYRGQMRAISRISDKSYSFSEINREESKDHSAITPYLCDASDGYFD